MEEDGSSSDTEYQQQEIRKVDASVSISSTTHILDGHSQAVTTLTGGKVNQNLVASGSKDFSARLWDTEAGQCVSVLKGHSGAVRSCCFSADERVLFTAGDTCVGIWDRATGTRVSTLRAHQGHITSVDVGFKTIGDVTDGVMLLSSAYDGCSKVWDLRVQLPVRTCVGHLRAVSSSVFSADMKAVYSAGFDALVRVFNIASVTSVPPFSIPNPPAIARNLRALKCSRAPLARCRLAPDGTWLATASTDGTLGVTKLGPDTTTLLMGHETGAALADCNWGVLPASSRVATTGGREVLLWDMAALQATVQTNSRPPSSASSEALVRRKSSSASAGGVQCLLRFSGAGVSSLRWGNSGARLWSCCLRHDGVYAGANDGTIAYWSFPEAMREGA